MWAAGNNSLTAGTGATAIGTAFNFQFFDSNATQTGSTYTMQATQASAAWGDVMAAFIVPGAAYSSTLTETATLTSSLLRTPSGSIQTIATTIVFTKTASRALTETIANTATALKIGGKQLIETVSSTAGITNASTRSLSKHSPLLTALFELPAAPSQKLSRLPQPN